MPKLGPKYFDNRKEQNRLKGSIHAAIPIGAKYYNVIIVLTELIAEFAALSFREEVHNTEPEHETHL